MTKNDKVTVEDIIGIVHTDETTNSVEEVRKLRGRENRTEKRYNVYDVDGTIFLEDHKEGSYHIGLLGNVDINCLNDIANRLNNLSEENEQLKKQLSDDFNQSNCITVQKSIISDLKKENEQLKNENKRLTDKLNETALEFLNYNMVTMGKATEISEMCYSDFLKYRKENGNPMELQE